MSELAINNSLFDWKNYLIQNWWQSHQLVVLIGFDDMLFHSLK